MGTITDMSLTLCEAGTGKRESVKNWGKCHTRRRLVGKTQEVKEILDQYHKALILIKNKDKCKEYFTSFNNTADAINITEQT